MGTRTRCWFSVTRQKKKELTVAAACSERGRKTPAFREDLQFPSAPQHELASTSIGEQRIDHSQHRWR
jgi:hypothetical protein